MKRGSGFGLIELTVAVSLLAFLAAFIVPTYQLILAQLQLNSAAAEVADWFRLAEQKTVTEQRIYGVTLTVGASTVPYFFYDSATGSKTTQDTLALPGGMVIDAVNFSGATDIRFTTAGAPAVSGDVVLRDTVRNKYRTVEIRPSGAVMASQGES